MKTFFYKISFLLIICIVLTLFFIFPNKGFTLDQNIIPDDQSLSFKGVTEPVNEAILSSSVDGTIKEILVKEGDWVQKGDPVIRLYRREQEMEVTLRFKIWKSKAALNAAQTEEKNLQELYKSSKQLYEKNHSVSKEELTRLKVRSEQSHFKRMELEIREEQERIQYELAKEQLSKRILYAPFQGIVTHIFLQAGERSKSNQQLIKLVNPKVCYFKCNAEERFAYTLKPGNKVTLYIQAGKKDIKKTGEVIFVSPVVDPASGLMKIKVIFENKDQLIRPGISGKMILPRQ
ncbi:Secretion protein HlyD [Candidatus Magnetomorum sp. HK-1]|nr:Secretion protein HlyD [Candidatus Magnetomorum sp. HK-1]